MNDTELELRLREELHERLARGEAPDRLLGHVARLGLDEATRTPESGALTRRRGRRAGLGGLAAAASIAAVVVAGLAWSTTHAPIAATPSLVPSVPASPTGPARTAPAATATPEPSPTSSMAWDGQPVTVRQYDRLDAEFGWAVGSEPGGPTRLYVTGDGGLSWDAWQVPWFDDGGPVSDLTFTDRSRAFVATTTGRSGAYSDNVLLSSDGGHTWTQAVVLAGSAFEVSQLDVVDSEHGWLVLTRYSNPAVSQLYRTTDGGVTWTLLADSSKASVAPSRVDFVSADEGWADSAKDDLSTILHTLDGGQTWQAASLPLDGASNIGRRAEAPHTVSGKLVIQGSVAQVGAMQAVIATWRSADDGLTWTRDGETIGVSYIIAGASDQAAGRAFAGTEMAGQTSALLGLVPPDGPTEPAAGKDQYLFDATSLEATASAAVLTARAFSPTDAWLTVDRCAPSGLRSGIFVACPYLLATSDGGKTWRPMLWQPAGSGPAPTPVAPAVPPCCTMNPLAEHQRTREPLTDWLDSTHGWAVVGTALYWSADGGATWDSGNPLPASGTIQFVDREHGWLVTSGSSDPGGPVYVRTPVYRTSDGGKTWAATDLPTTASEANWTWAHFADATHGVVARCPQLIAGQDEAACEAFTTDDGGQTFEGPVTRTFATPIDWLSAAVGYGIAYAADRSEQSDSPLLDLTLDGGRTWTTQPLEKPAGATLGSWPLDMELAPGGAGRLLVRFYTDTSSLLARYETADGGRTWRLAWHGADTSAVAVRAAGDLLVGVSADRIWASSDFGATWTQLAAAPAETHDFEFVDAQTGWLVRAPTYSSPPDALLGTTDGGRTWHVVLQAPSIVTNP